MREREIKLDTPEDDLSESDLDAAVAAVEGARIERVDSRVLTAHYYDTADLRLARWGSSLRHRDDEGWTVKLPVSRAGSEVVRDEIHFDGDAQADEQQPPDAALQLVDSLLRGEPVGHVATLVTHRRAIVLSHDGTPLGELTDDRVRVERPASSAAVADGPTEFHELELELIDGGGSTAGADGDDGPDHVSASVLDALEAIGCVPSTHASKVSRALGPRASEPADVVPLELDERPDAASVVRHALATSVQHLLLALPVVRVGDDPEGVHDARVALRRLRSDLKTFRPLLDRSWANDLRDRAKWLADRLGDVRDDDVHLEILEAVDAPEPVLDAIRRERDGHRAELLTTLDEPRTRDLLRALVAAANEPVLLNPLAEPADDVLLPYVRKRWKRLREAVRALPDDPTTAELHGVRIVAKRCRYATMASAPAFGDDAVTFAKRLGKLQDALGAIHDDELLADRLRELAAELPQDDAFDAGRVSGRLQANADAARADWPARWREVKRASLF